MSDDSPDQDKLAGSLQEALAQSDLTSLTSDYAELLIDGVLDDGILKEIPVLGTITAVAKTGLAVRDRMFTRKLIRFLLALKDTSPDERAEMVRRLEEDETFTQRVGECLVLLLERLDHMEKPELLARAFQAYIKGKIDAVQLQLFFRVIDRAFMPDLVEAKRIWHRNRKEVPMPERMVDCGLAWTPPGTTTTAIVATSICEPFIEHVLRDPPPP